EAGGVLVNAQGAIKEAGTFGIESAWCDFYGSRGGVTEGLAILQHPANRWYPDKWFTRDYGFMSPTSFYWPENELYRTFEKGELIALRYRVVVHTGDTEAAGIGALFDTYQKTDPVSELRLASLLKEVELYRYGQSRISLIAITGLVNDSIDLPGFRKKLADGLAQILASAASFDSKRFVCEQLALVGTAEHVERLAMLMAEEQTADISRNALEIMETPAANEALLIALQQVSGKVKVGVIGSLGQRGEKFSIDILEDLIYDADASVAKAAIKALSKIEYPESVAALEKAIGTLSGAIRNEAIEAYLICADRYFSQGEKTKAYDLFQAIYDAVSSAPTKAAALKGILLSASDVDADLVNDVLTGEDIRLQAVVFKIIRDTQDAEMISVATGHFRELSVDGQIRFLTALGDSEDKEVLDIILQASISDNTDVRIAAVNAMARSPESSFAFVLAMHAASSAGAEQQAAREGLYRITGDDVEQNFLIALRDNTPNIDCELLMAIAERRMISKTTPVLEAARGNHEKVRLEAIKTLRFIAGDKDIEGLVNLLMQLEKLTEINEMERTLIVLASGQINPAKLESTLLNRYPALQSILIKSSILNILGQTRGSTAYLLLKDALNDEDLEVRKSAIKSLSNWPDAAPAETLLNTAQTDSDRINQILALRGYIKLVTRPSTRSAEETVEMFTLAMSTASQPAEKKAILSVLPSYRCEQAVKLAEMCLEDDEIKKEAELALKLLENKTVLMFDFQPRGAPVMARYIEVNPDTIYDDQIGFGWTTAPGAARDRVAGTDQTRDFIFDSAEKVFKINLTKGNYLVTVYLGDMTVRHDQMSVYADDDLKIDKVTTAGGEVRKIDFDVTVADGVLELMFRDVGGSDANWVCGGIEIR
ncbi:MAG: hypothetical protein GY869_25090, partial [Planctomycetes bacterium]|nr:hypothetical protein [Planctomycetota bacterium]